jgi:hypothetical protein
LNEGRGPDATWLARAALDPGEEILVTILGDFDRVLVLTSGRALGWTHGDLVADLQYRELARVQLEGDHERSRLLIVPQIHHPPYVIEVAAERERSLAQAFEILRGRPGGPEPGRGGQA